MDEEDYSIGQLAERTGLSVRTIRYYSDRGIVPETSRSRAGYRRYDVRALARLDLVRTLRDLGLPISTVHQVLDQSLTLSEVAHAHAQALDAQIQGLQLRRAVLRAVAKRGSTPEEMSLMHQLARMSDAERHRLIHDFIDDVCEGLDGNPDLIALLRTALPELPDDPAPEQVQAWVDLADLVQNQDFRVSVRRMVEHQADERADGDRTGLHHDLTEYVRDTVTRAVDNGVQPDADQAASILDGLVARYAAEFGTVDSPEYRRALRHRLDVAKDPRAERYWHLLSVINGWPVPPTLAPAFDWFDRALTAHPQSRDATGVGPTPG